MYKHYAYVHMFCKCVPVFVTLYFLLFVYKANMRVNKTLVMYALLGPGIISHITKNKVFPCVQPALFPIPQESRNLFLPAYLPSSVFCPLFSHWLNGAGVGVLRAI